MNKGNITICLCASRSIINKENVMEVSQILNKAGYTIAIEADLCEKAITSSSEMRKIASTTIIACYPRAVYALFDWLDLKPAAVLDIRNNKAEILSCFGLSESSASRALDADIDVLPAKPGEDAWYPLIDKERCCACGKCYDFCLFGVYTMEKGVVEVSSPTHCKNNCPACARVCPNKAIIFPKYPKSPVNGGLAEEEPVAMNPKLVYNEALQMRLEQRRASVSLLKIKNKNKA
jgi:NAD-dependent dihydropyrimidine dehydrogenase PreA subunit